LLVSVSTVAERFRLTSGEVGVRDFRLTVAGLADYHGRQRQIGGEKIQYGVLHSGFQQSEALCQKNRKWSSSAPA